MRRDLDSTSFGNRPAIAFHADKNAVNQTSVSSTATVTWPRVNINVGGWLSTTSNDFWPPAGNYFLHSAVRLASGIAAGESITANIEKDGLVLIRGPINQSEVTGGGVANSVSAIVNTTGTSFFKISISLNATSTGTIIGTTTQTYWMGHEIVR